MSDELRTRNFSIDELERALEPFADAQDVVAARPIKIASDAVPEPAPAPHGEPFTSLGIGPPRAFEAAPSTEPSMAALSASVEIARTIGVALTPPEPTGEKVRAPIPPRTRMAGTVARASALPLPSEARPSTPPSKPASKPASKAAREPTQLTRSSQVDERFGRRLPATSTQVQRTAARLRLPVLKVWHGWLALMVVAGFALGGLVALSMHTSRATASRPASLPRPGIIAPAPAPAAPEPVKLDAHERAVASASALGAREVGAAVPRRRSAVDALFAGHTRAAFEQYQRLLAAPPAGLTDTAAIAQVVQLLERELRACEQEAGTPCGF